MLERSQLSSQRLLWGILTWRRLACSGVSATDCVPQPYRSRYSPRYTIVYNPNPTLHRDVVASIHSSMHRGGYSGVHSPDIGRMLIVGLLNR